MKIRYKSRPFRRDYCRIPSIVTTGSGRLIAFCENRGADNDFGNVNIVMNYSDSSGKDWHYSRFDPLLLIGDRKIDGIGTRGTWRNPTSVYHKESSSIWLFVCANPDGKDPLHDPSAQQARTYVLTSNDDGISWSRPKRIAIPPKFQNRNRKWIASGPGVAFVIDGGTHNGRMLVPYNATGGWVMYNDKPNIDKPNTNWHFRKTGGRGTEAQIAGTSEELIIMTRKGSKPIGTKNGKQFLKSFDGGDTWGKPYYDLLAPSCQGSIFRHSNGFYYLTSPKDSTDYIQLTLYRSPNGKNWSRVKVIKADDSRYSCLTELKNGKLGCLFEPSASNKQDEIQFVALS